MKTNFLMVLAMSLSFATAFAQTTEGQQVLNSDPINVDGYLAEEKPVTDGELEEIRSELRKQKVGTQLNKEKAKDLGKLTQQTEKLLESQDEYIDSKVESTQAIKEFNKKHEENQRKLRCIMEESNAPECDPYKNKYNSKREEPIKQEVEVVQAAPVAPVAVSTEEVAPTTTDSPFETIKLLPYFGGTSYNGEVEQLEAELSAGMRLESNINKRFSMGLGFNFAQLKTEDFANNFGVFGDPMIGDNYYGFYGQQGREIQYRSMGLDIYGKFFVTNGERFRPYISAGLGLARANIKYTENDPYTIDAYSFGNEEYTTTFATGSLALGSEIMITRGFGLNIEAQYSTGLGDSFSSEDSKNPYNSPDQKRLQELGDEIINSNALSIFAGAVIVF